MLVLGEGDGRQAGFFDVEERLRELSAKGDDLEQIAALVGFVLC